MEDNVIRGPFGHSAHSRSSELQIARLREIEHPSPRSGLGKKGHVFRPSDRLIAARATGRLVRTAQDYGVSVRQLREALESRGTDRIDRYTLSPSLDDATAQARGKKLQGKVSGFLAVAVAVAVLTDRDPDALKIDVLAGTSLWSKPSSAESDEDPRANNLALELIEMGHAVSRQKKVHELFATARRLRGSWDAISEKVVTSANPLLSGDSFLEWFEHWTEAPPLPSVPLVRHVHSLLSLPRVRIEREGRPKIYELAELTDNFDGDAVIGWLELAREIRLAIGPTTGPSELGVMFESRAHVRLFVQGDEAAPMELRPTCTLKPIDDITSAAPAAVFQTHVDGTWRRIATVDPINDLEARVFEKNGLPLLWSMNPLNPSSPTVEHWYFSWAAVNEATVSHWLDRPSGTNDAVAIPHSGNRPGDTILYAQGSTAHEIESDLESGGLEEALGRAIEDLRSAITGHEGQWRSRARSVHEERMARWGMSEQELDS